MKPMQSSFGITAITHISVRANPDHRSELISQLLFGESFQINDQWNEWLHVRLLPTGQQGWIINYSYIAVSAPALEPGEGETFVNLQTVYVSRIDNPRHPIIILPGSTLPTKPGLGKVFKLGKIKYKFESPLPESLVINHQNKMEALALIFINAPFLWGGRSLFGIDGSGLIQLVFKMYGINVPGNLDELLKVGHPVPFAHDSHPGDLAFFENKEGEIIHSGIITQAGKIIHCLGQVREDPIDHAGIYGVEEEKYIFYLRIINRILPDTNSAVKEVLTK